MKTNIPQSVKLDYPQTAYIFIFFAIITLDMRFKKKLHGAWLTSKNRSLKEKKCCQLNIFIKKKLIKNGSNKKKSFHLLCIQKERNKVVSVHGNETMNRLVLIFYTRLWPLHETCECHSLNGFFPYNLWDVQQFEILLNCHISITWKLSLFFYKFLAFFYVSYKKSHNLYGTN